MTQTTFLTTADMAARTGKTRDFWARLCASKRLVGVKLGDDWRVAEDVFEEFMRAGGKATARKRDPRMSASQQRRSA